jgi:hypothetical protein
MRLMCDEWQAARREILNSNPSHDTSVINAGCSASDDMVDELEVEPEGRVCGKDGVGRGA